MLSLAETKKADTQDLEMKTRRLKSLDSNFKYQNLGKSSFQKHMHHNSQPFKIDLNKKPFSKHKTLQTFKDDAQGFKEKHITKSSHIKKIFLGIPDKDSNPEPSEY